VSSPLYRICKTSAEGRKDCEAESLDVTQALNYLNDIQKRFRDAKIEAEFSDDGRQLICRPPGSLQSIFFSIEPA
jgi:hypothetical protein